MQFQPQIFNIVRKTDRELVGAFSAVAERFPVTSRDFSAYSQQVHDIDPLLELDSTAFTDISYQFESKYSVSIHRPMHKGEAFDRVTVNSNGDGNLAAFAELVAAARNAFGALDMQVPFDLLDKANQQFYASRAETLNSIERLQAGFFTEMQQFVKSQAEEAAAARKELDAEYAAKRKELDELEATRQSAINAEREELERRQAAVDDRSSIHVRRERQLAFLDKLKDRKFDLQPATHKRQLSVPIAYSVLLAVLGLLLIGTWADIVAGRVADTPAVIRGAFSLGAFVGVFGFFLSWLNSWSRRFVDEEHRVNRLELDVERAIWIVETGIAWETETKQPVPQLLMDRLSRNLFAEEVTEDQPLTISEAIICEFTKQASRGAKFKIADAELTLGRPTKSR